jgi:hypothetical protein
MMQTLITASASGLHLTHHCRFNIGSTISPDFLDNRQQEPGSLKLKLQELTGTGQLPSDNPHPQRKDQHPSGLAQRPPSHGIVSCPLKDRLLSLSYRDLKPIEAHRELLPGICI